MRLVARCLLLLPFAALLTGCGSGAEGARATAPPFIESGDLREIRARGTLRVLLPMIDPHEYLPRGDSPADTERDLVEAFARQQDLQPYWIYVDSRSDLIPYLLEGKGDLIAANLTATEERREQVAFTTPVSFVREQVVTRRGDLGVNEAADLEGRRIVVRASSSFRNTLEKLRESFPGIVIDEVAEQLDTDEIIHGVATRRYDLTVADSNVVEAALAYRDDIRVAFDLTGDRAVAWAVRPHSKKLLQSLNLYLAEAQLTQRRKRPSFGDLAEIRERKVLRVLTRNSAATYFLWRGKLMGFDYELAQRFAEKQGLRLEVVVPQRNEDLLQLLLDGRGDIVTAALTPSDDAERRGVAFTRPYNYVAPIVVARNDGGLPVDLADLADRSIYVQRSSPYWDQLGRLRREAGFALHAAPEQYETEEIIGMVADGRYDLTVADSHILDIELTWREDVAAAFALAEAGPASWAVRESNPELLAAVDKFITKEYRGLFYNVIYERYFKSPKRAHTHRELKTRADQLSPYDRWVKEAAETHGFDWRLIVAQIYQESEFDPAARSFAGAVGLLQVLPRTGEQLGVSELEDPAANIAAGVEYLAWVRERFEDDLPYWERMWFTLAAYNVGHGHVVDARRLAAEMGLDSDRWFGNVERAMLLLSRPEYARKARHGYCRGSEPVRYVREIRSRYEAYLETLTATGEREGRASL